MFTQATNFKATSISLILLICFLFPIENVRGSHGTPTGALQPFSFSCHNASEIKLEKVMNRLEITGSNAKNGYYIEPSRRELYIHFRIHPSNSTVDWSYTGIWGLGKNVVSAKE